MSSKLKRVAFWGICAGLMAAGAAAKAQVPKIAEAGQRAPVQNRFEFSQPQMGVPFRIVLYAPNKLIARLAAEAAFQRVSNLNQILSDYETDSELNELSRTSGKDRWVKVSPDLWYVLERAQTLARQSDGAFDVTVGPYVVLWRKARRIKELPPAELLENARAAVGYEKMQLDRAQRKVKLLAPGMKLDLGGIGKGYGVDEALKVLRTNGINRALVAGSGDMAVSEPPPGKSGWRIELAPLDASNAPPTRFLILSNAALATSGDVFQRLEIQGKRYSHIVDAKTGLGLTDHSLITVIAKDCTTADSLTKVVCVLGPQSGMALLKEYYPFTAVHVVRKPGERIEMMETPEFSSFYDKNSETAEKLK